MVFYATEGYYYPLRFIFIRLALFKQLLLSLNLYTFNIELFVQFIFGLHLTTEPLIYNLHLHNKPTGNFNLEYYFVSLQPTQHVFHYHHAGFSAILKLDDFTG